MPKGFTVRLDDDQAVESEAIARDDGVLVDEEIRQAITVQIAERRKDEGFRARLRQSIQANQTVLERLARRVDWRYLDLADSALHASAAEFGGVEFYPDPAPASTDNDPSGIASRVTDHVTTQTGGSSTWALPRKR